MRKIILLSIGACIILSCSPKTEKKEAVFPSNSPKSGKVQNAQKEQNTVAFVPKVTTATFDQIQKLYKKKSDTVYVTNYWATWCPPCVEEMPGFVMLQNEYQNFKVKFIFVSLDDLNTRESDVLPFAARHQMKNVYQLASSSEAKKIGSLIPQWEGAIPVTIIQKGKYSENLIGGQSPDFLIQLIGEYLKK